MPSAKTFPRYPDLPTELRRQIVQEAAKPLIVAFKARYVINSWDKKDSAGGGISLARYACLDSIWQEVIEPQTFQRLLLTLDDIKPFAAICRKRRGILRYIAIDLHEGSWPPQFRANGSADFNSMRTLALYTLFGIMKDWDPAEGKQKGLKIDLRGGPCNGTVDTLVRHDFSHLPKVRIIGELLSPCITYLHPSTIMSLYEKLPNAHRLSMQLPLAPIPKWIQEATDVICALRDLPCNLKKLSLPAYGSAREHWLGVQERLPVIRCLTTPGSQWSDTLTTLEIACFNDAALVLKDASMTVWTQLKSLKLNGVWDSEPVGSREETGSSVVQGLIAALPQMPRIATIKMFIEPHFGVRDIFIDLYLGPSTAVTEYFEQWEELPFVPESNNGLARLVCVSIPGQLAAELQDVVWRNRGLVVSVFRLPGDQYGIWQEEDDPDDFGDPDTFYDGWTWDRSPDGYGGVCQQWNREKDAWDCFFWEWKERSYETLKTYPVLPTRAQELQTTTA